MGAGGHEGMRCNCVPEEKWNRRGRRAAHSAGICSVPEVRSGSAKLMLIHISPEPLQNLWYWLCRRRCSTSLPKHNLNWNLQRCLKRIPCCFYSFSDITDGFLSASCWLFKFTLIHINKQFHEHSNCSMSCTAFYCYHKHLSCPNANQLQH